jgi:hypothetical protein
MCPSAQRRQPDLVDTIEKGDGGTVEFDTSKGSMPGKVLNAERYAPIELDAATELLEMLRAEV